jgi:hypothetical protein
MFILLIVSSHAETEQPAELTPTGNHHVAKLNSNQPYVAGYHVNTHDPYSRERVQATAITVSFPETDPTSFPENSWLGAGMFVQGQDSKIINVDYAFYTMLVLEDSGTMYLDIGFHQTRESTAPLQLPTSELLYAKTWQISGIDPAAQVTLLARWDTEGFVHYSLITSEDNITVSSINVADLPNCASIIRQFYAGTATNSNAFPFGHYVYYFQFGVVSSQTIANEHWSADLTDPKILRKTGWDPVDAALTTKGDVSYLDSDWMWGGAPYLGVDAQYHQNPLENPYEVIFFHNGRTLPSGTLLWHTTSQGLEVSATVSLQQLGPALAPVIVATAISISFTQLRRLKKKT